MTRTARALLIIGAILASASAGHAGGRAASEVSPFMATLGDPSPQPASAPSFSPPSAPATAAPISKTADKTRIVKHREGRLASRRGNERTTAVAHAPAKGGAVAASADAAASLAKPAPAADAPSPSTMRPADTTSPPGSAPATGGASASDPAAVNAGAAPADARAARSTAETTAIERAAPGPTSTSAEAAGPREGPAPTIAELVARHARENGVPFALAEAVIRIESRGNSRAAHGGALGLMQIKPGTARAVGFNGGARGLFDPDINLRFGMKVLGAAFKTAGGDVCRALMQYQSGHLATHMSRANHVYCSKARAIMAGA